LAPATRGLALLVAGAFFMENLDGTIISTAAPRMARSFGVAAADINVTMTAYLLALALFIPLSGWLADRFGARRVFCSALVVFTVTSGLCALSTSLPELVVMRVLQGVGGAMMVPVGRLVVLQRTSRAEMISAIAYLTWPGLLAPVLAPAIGGAVTQYWSWRWIFVVNLPLGVVGFVVALRLVSNPVRERAARLDWAGFVLCGAALTAFVYALELLGETTEHWALTIGATAVFAAAATAAGRHLLGSSRPLLDVRVLRIPTFRITHFGGSLYRTAIGAAPFVLALMYQDGFGWSPLRAGLLVIAVFAGNLAIKPLTTGLLRRFGFRPILLVNGFGAAVSLALCGLISASTSIVVIVVVLFVSGVLRSIGFTAYNTIAFADIEPARLTDANTVSAVIQQLAIGLGAAVGALALRVATPLCHALGIPVGPVTPYRVAFFLLAAMAFVAIAETLTLRRDAGRRLHEEPVKAGAPDGR
jgi:EmrB/QacA subfamily drug resistance transporter